MAEYSDFVNLSDLVLEHYQQKETHGLDKYILTMENFIKKEVKKKEDNKPLVIVGEPGSGRKSLITQWITQHRKQSEKRFDDIIIPHFTKVSQLNNNYCLALYNTLVKLREILDIKQKVELIDEKLRRFFLYWLEIINTALENQIVNDATIIIIFDGIDYFIDYLTHEISNLAFWLPKNFPLRIKVIVTCERNSEAHSYFEEQGLEIIQFEPFRLNQEQIFSNSDSKEYLLSEALMNNFKSIIDDCNLHLNNSFLVCFSKLFFPFRNEGNKDISAEEIEKIYSGFDLEKIKASNSIYEFYCFILQYLFSKLGTNFQNILVCISVSGKGLTIEEIFETVKFEPKDWAMAITIFHSLIVKSRNLYLIFDYEFKRAVYDSYGGEEKVKEMQLKLAETLKKSPISIRKLDEETYQLFMSKNLFTLKETISIIENFLLLFNPNTKFSFMRFWQTLEANGFDPVVEYNKSIEGFEMHYLPSTEDIFKIILQVSRFLKEFSDFENRNTPSFRHPPIMGNEDIEEIGLKEEAFIIKIFYKAESKSYPEILSDIEKLNVDVPTNRQRVRELYLKDLTNVKEQEDVNVEEMLIQSKKRNSIIDRDENEEIPIYWEENEDKEEEEEKEEEVEEIEPQFYYYKRWLWIVFPWACMSPSPTCNYSKEIQKCFTSATQYMSVADEKKYTQRAIKIALEAKLKKKSLIASANAELKEEIDSLKRLKEELVFGVMTERESRDKEQEEKDETNEESKIEQESKLPPIKTNQKQKVDEYPFFVTGAYLNLNLSKNNASALSNNTHDYTFSTSKLLNKSKVMKEKFKFFNLNSANLQKQSSLTILPKLKDSIISHNNKEIYLAEQTSKGLQKGYNDLVYANKVLAKHLKELKIIEYNQNSFTQDHEVIKLSSKIEGLNAKILAENKAMETSKKFKQRLKKILAICNKNKQLNTEFIRGLNYLLTNFKKLIDWENDDIFKFQKEIEILAKQKKAYDSAIEENKRQHQNLILQIQKELENKKRVDLRFIDGDEMIEAKANESIDMMNRKIRENEESNEMEKIRYQQIQKEMRRKTQIDRINKGIQDFEKLTNLLSLKDHHEDLTSNPKWITLNEKLEKIRELKGALIVKRKTLSELEEEKAKKIRQLELLETTMKETSKRTTRKKSTYSSKQLLENMSVGNIKDQVKVLKRDYEIKKHTYVKYKKAHMELLSVFGQMAKKAGMENDVQSFASFDFIKFTELLREKMEQFQKNTDPETYQAFLDNSLSPSTLFKDFNDDTLQLPVRTDRSK